MKVKYFVVEAMTYSGEMEIDEQTYNDWKDKSDEVLGSMILDIVGRNDPTDAEITDVLEFNPVDEEGEEDD